MDIISSVLELRRVLQEKRCEGSTIGCVPTMGALHKGHLALVDASRRDGNKVTVMSVYVNPSQFGPGEDLSHYPRDLDRDRGLAQEARVDILFTPTDQEMYPGGHSGQRIWVDPGRLGEVLEGQYRPGHFRGVATVVTKLFNMVQPNRAYFGQKDAQQALVVQALARDLSMGVDVRVVPTVREPDGLALSSRNIYLSEQERAQAHALYRGLSDARAAFTDGEVDASRLAALVGFTIRSEASLAEIQYVAVSEAETLEPIAGPVDRPALISLAVFFGATRLIDNTTLIPASQ